MAWVAKAVGVVDSLGYLYCRSCASGCWNKKQGDVVYADSSPMNTELCDRCGEVLTTPEQRLTSAFVRDSEDGSFGTEYQSLPKESQIA